MATYINNTKTYIDDHTYVAAAQTGSRQAFETLVDRYYRQIQHYLTRQVNDHELAADLTQETFVDAFRRLDRLQDDRPFAAWLYRIARNNMLHELRKHRVRQNVSLEWLHPHDQSALADVTTGERLEACHERDLIHTVLNQLSPTLREPLLLYTLWGFPGQEVARILDISAPAARQRISRAREEFCQRYQELYNVDQWRGS